MIDYEAMTYEDRKRYELTHTENARKRYVVKEWHDAEALMLAIVFGLVWAVYLIGSAMEAAVL